MKYTDGIEIELGDKVIISGKHHGVVVANIDGSEYSDAYPKEQWSYLGSGVMIDTDFGGLVHYQEDNIEGETIELESRGEEKL
jgi:hypothetical protein